MSSRIPHTPTRQAALQVAAAIRPDDYARTRNYLTGAVTGLSPYLTHGVLTLREVLIEVLKQQPIAVGHKLVYELGWREFFRHVWSHAGDGIFRSLHPGPLPDTSYAKQLPTDIREGSTGVPAIDEAVRTLYATGVLHNHARMWLASYVVHIRRVHWRAGADWLVAHLLDGDLASNHLSWQWVAGTGSSKPYLFNADNVARYAPPQWHSPGTAVDQSYEALNAIARSNQPAVASQHPWPKDKTDRAPTAELPLVTMPPVDLDVGTPDSISEDQFQGREVWLVHPWALRPPPEELSTNVIVIGIYLREHHDVWPWTVARWRWADAIMREVTEKRIFIDAESLAKTLKSAAVVRAVADLHISRWLEFFVRLEPEPALFPKVDMSCNSFSQWWTRATRGHQHATELL